MTDTDRGLLLGRRELNDRGFDCCGKPRGCTNQNPGCACLNHPYKCWVRGEIPEPPIPTGGKR